jgi:alpha-galactosidase
MPSSLRFIFCGLGIMLLALPTIAKAVAVEHGVGAKAAWVSNSQLRVDADLASGLYSVKWKDGSILSNATAVAILSDGTPLIASSFAHHQCAETDVTPFADELGNGIAVTIHHLDGAQPELRQRICVYENQPFCVVSLEIVASHSVATNNIAPMITGVSGAIGGVSLPDAANPLVLFVPFDNDAGVRYNNHHDPAKDPDSYEVTAVYDNQSRHGIVLGSITHDVWKTGIEARNIANGVIHNLRVYGGATGTLSRDTQPHGNVSGTTIASPRIWIGSFADWRDGLEAFGNANARIHPPLAWDGGVIFGWNSWAAYRAKIDFAKYINAADFFKTHLQPAGFENQGTTYINFDSFWDNCTEDQLREAARHAHANGQKAGIYWTPFTAWGDDMNHPVEGTDGKYLYSDILLKDSTGKPLPKLDKGHPIDPTHPGALARIDWQMHRFVDWGYDFVKLDFVNSGSLEGSHFDPHISTGVAAYNLGMQRIVSDLDPRKIGRPFYISLSIAPLFPAGYGHSRRISCDAFGHLKDSEYVLNALTYGWWISGTLYDFNDPDHTVLTVEKKATTLEEARTRLNTSIISGTMLLDSDDLTNSQAQERARQLLTNPQINAVARAGHPFRPVEGNSGDRAAQMFVRSDPNGDLCLAVFNFDSNKATSVQIAPQRIGLSSSVNYRMQSLWRKQESMVNGPIAMELPPSASEIFVIRSK